VCDAVQAETYKIDGVEVSNFVLPLYFAIGEQTGARNDFLNRAYGGRTLKPFGVNPGGYVGFFDLASGQDDTYPSAGEDEPQALLPSSLRLAVKGALELPVRRSRLYRELPNRLNKLWLDRYRHHST
jgi:hypothetical protein